MLRTRILIGLFGVTALAAACGGTPAATSTPAGTTGPTATSAATSTPAATPTATSAPTGTAPAGGDICAAFPTVAPGALFPSFAPDPALEAKFPDTIDGNPVTEKTSGSWAQFACLGGSATVAALQGTAQYNLLALTWGSAKATVDDEEVELFAFRLPGGDANQIVGTLGMLAQASGGSLNGTMSQGTAGDKPVLVFTDSTDGSTSYGYISGDTLITASDITQSQADKIFSAVQ